ncbi:MAG: hypothetical protein ACK56I_10360, partial [bacterium]
QLHGAHPQVLVAVDRKNQMPVDIASHRTEVERFALFDDEVWRPELRLEILLIVQGRQGCGGGRIALFVASLDPGTKCLHLLRRHRIGPDNFQIAFRLGGRHAPRFDLLQTHLQ